MVDRFVVFRIFLVDLRVRPAIGGLTKTTGEEGANRLCVQRGERSVGLAEPHRIEVAPVPAAVDERKVFLRFVGKNEHRHCLVGFHDGEKPVLAIDQHAFASERDPLVGTAPESGIDLSDIFGNGGVIDPAIESTDGEPDFGKLRRDIDDVHVGVGTSRSGEDAESVVVHLEFSKWLNETKFVLKW